MPAQADAFLVRVALQDRVHDRCGEEPAGAAAACGASRATGYRLWRRFRAGGWQALADRPSRPRRQPRRLAPEAEQEILRWRAELGAGPAVIATIVERPASTVGKVLRRAGCSRLERARRDPRVRYERERPGELLHVDTKKLGRFWEIGKRIRRDGVNRSRRAGWQHLHVCIDDHSRLAYCEILRSERKGECAAFLRRAVSWYAEQGIVVERVLTDNAKAYHSHLWRDTCAELGIERRYTRPYSPLHTGLPRGPTGSRASARARELLPLVTAVGANAPFHALPHPLSRPSFPHNHADCRH